MDILGKIQFICLYLLATIYTTSCIQINCAPATDLEELHAYWTSLAHESCLHESSMMLPAMAQLNHYKRMALEISQCYHQSSCDIDNSDYLCANCHEITNATLPNSCPNHITENATIEQRSRCPWYYWINVDKFRYPLAMTEAVCLHNCFNSNYSKAFQQGGEDPSLYHCEPVYHNIPVLYAKIREYIDNEPCEYELKYQKLSIGCTFAMKVVVDLFVNKGKENSHHDQHPVSQTRHNRRHKQQEVSHLGMNIFKQCMSDGDRRMVCQQGLIVSRPAKGTSHRIEFNHCMKMLKNRNKRNLC